MFPHEANAAEQIGDEILLWIRSAPLLDLALCDAFPAEECRWDDKRQCWVIKATHYEELQRLVKEHLGAVLVVA
jgi:hypothetical protein